MSSFEQSKIMVPTKLTNSWAVSFLYFSCHISACCYGWVSPSTQSAKMSSPWWPKNYPSMMNSIHLSTQDVVTTPFNSKKTSSCLNLAINNDQFDMSKPTFDLLSFRPIRSDAILRYNSLNQSEPLRINLYLLSSIILLLYPTWCESVTSEVASPLSIALTTLGGIGCASLFWRERSRRSNQLNRMEKELNAEKLVVRYMPLDSAISSARYTVRLGDLKGKKRILAIRGTEEQIAPIWEIVCALRNRLAQSSTLVVFVPTDGSKNWGWESGGSFRWLAEAMNVDGQEEGGGGWLDYFRDLLDKGEGSSSSEDTHAGDRQLAWFALNFKGRSIASALGEAPRLIELLGQQLQPMEILDETDQAERLPDEEDSTLATSTKKQILECQGKFYSVLTNSSDSNEMEELFSSNPAVEVNEVMIGGGRIDAWDKCLEPDARPVGMVISGSDAWIPNENSMVAYSTCIEFPKTNLGVSTGSLLAMQRWVREGDGGWKLDLHQTIPWSAASKAGGTLRCDCRGCVALTRSPEKRTLGGLIG